MFEITFTDLALFIWGAVATAFAFKYHSEAFVAKVFVHKLITDDALRDEIVAAHKKFKQENPT